MSEENKISVVLKLCMSGFLKLCCQGVNSSGRAWFDCEVLLGLAGDAEAMACDTVVQAILPWVQSLSRYTVSQPELKAINLLAKFQRYVAALIKIKKIIFGLCVCCGFWFFFFF